jgi:hypothetical protein
MKTELKKFEVTHPTKFGEGKTNEKQKPTGSL